MDTYNAFHNVPYTQIINILNFTNVTAKKNEKSNSEKSN